MAGAPFSGQQETLIVEVPPASGSVAFRSAKGLLSRSERRLSICDHHGLDALVEILVPAQLEARRDLPFARADFDVPADVKAEARQMIHIPGDDADVFMPMVGPAQLGER